MTVTNDLLRGLGAFDALRLLAGGKSRTRGGVVLAYHDIDDDPTVATHLSVTPALFRMHLERIRSWGLRFVPLEELTRAAVAGGDVDGKVAVVFDDGLEGVYRHAAPILWELGVPATVFMVTAARGVRPSWWPGAARTISTAHVRELADAGITFAPHSRSHPSLVGLAPAMLRDEVAGSRAEIEDMLGTAVNAFAYPFGHYDPAVRAAVEEAGYTGAYSFLNGRITGGLDRFTLPRFTMTNKQSRPRLAYHIARPAASWPDHQLEAFIGDGSQPK